MEKGFWLWLAVPFRRLVKMIDSHLPDCFESNPRHHMISSPEAGLKPGRKTLAVVIF